MYAKDPAKRLSSSSPALVLWTLAFTAFQGILGGIACAQPQVIRNITQETERLELTVNSSRVLTLDKRIPRMVVNNPELVTVTALSANEIQLAARKPGVTQINLWDEDGQVFTVDVLIYGDVKELEHALARVFPGASVKVIRLTNSLVLEGFVERPEDVSPIVRLAEDYAPKIVNNITVGGVQQILLKVKVMEVSRTKLRKLGVDFAQFSSGGGVVSSISGLISSASIAGQTVTASGETVRFGVVDGNDSFFGFIDALQQNNVAKILADPTLTAVSGRPAHFNVGGELPIVIPSGLGQTTIEYKKFGTQVDFVPIVLGNGNIRLEVRPRVSEIDDTRSIQLAEFSVPALRVREVDTGVEMKAGQTLALAGLVQTRVEARERGLPYLGDLPYIGAAFRSVREEVNEIELLILVTPEFVDGMDPHEVPQCGPGMESVSPTNCQLYWGGHLEVPACGPCGPGCYSNCGDGGCYSGQCSSGYVSTNMPMSMPSGKSAVVSDSSASPMNMPMGGTYGGESPEPVSAYEGLLQGGPSTSPPPSVQQPGRFAPVSQPAATGGQPVLADPSAQRDSQSRYQMPTQYTRENPQYRTTYQMPQSTTSTPGLIGPIGYDVEK
jgi:pilus assembly protein CpaC